MANRIAIMRDGMIEQVGTPHDVFARPANVFVASFIGTPQMNLLDADLLGVEGQQARLSLNGTTVSVRTDPAVSGLKSSRIKIGVRPRAFAPVQDAGPETVGAVAELIEPMGAETLIHARTSDGGDIRVVVPRDRRVKIGEKLNLQPEAGQVHVFAEDGKAVRT
jgi:ABC-type sugar transport system ATPase subunit